MTNQEFTHAYWDDLDLGLPFIIGSFISSPPDYTRLAVNV